MSSKNQFDVVVFGSGFGGSLLGTILAAEGWSVAIIDKSRHPRFAIGESSTPAADLLLHELSVRHRLDELIPLTRFGRWCESYPDILCGCKRGFSYFWHAGENGYQATADHQHELFVAASASRAVADTQWYRPDLDQLLVSVARQRGVALFEATEVTGIAHTAPHQWEVQLDQNGNNQRINAAFLIDASGPAGVLLRRLPIENWSNRLATRTYAIYGHFENVRPLADWHSATNAVQDDFPYPSDDAAVHHLFDDGWMWQLRFRNGLTSLGYVVAGDHAEPSQTYAQQPADRHWKSLLRARPELSEILGAARIASFPGHLFRSHRLQRMMSTGAGDDWAALPHTVGFVDPLHSTGIAHTLSGIERLSQILLHTSAVTQRSKLKCYSASIVNELQHIDRLVSGCYLGLTNFRLFTTWTMLYFAAATNFEIAWQRSSAERPSFLGADEERFVRTVRELHSRLKSMANPTCTWSISRMTEFEQQVREAIQPFNHVGLFEPKSPNMYWYTALAK